MTKKRAQKPNPPALASVYWPVYENYELVNCGVLDPTDSWQHNASADESETVDELIDVPFIKASGKIAKYIDLSNEAIHAAMFREFVKADDILEFVRYYGFPIEPTDVRQKALNLSNVQRAATSLTRLHELALCLRESPNELQNEVTLDQFPITSTIANWFRATDDETKAVIKELCVRGSHLYDISSTVPEYFLRRFLFDIHRNNPKALALLNGNDAMIQTFKKLRQNLIAENAKYYSVKLSRFAGNDEVFPFGFREVGFNAPSIRMLRSDWNAYQNPELVAIQEIFRLLLDNLLGKVHPGLAWQPTHRDPILVHCEVASIPWQCMTLVLRKLVIGKSVFRICKAPKCSETVVGNSKKEFHSDACRKRFSRSKSPIGGQ